jgi:DNA invertase Pin-like site-specific DNA recombinase
MALPKETQLEIWRRYRDRPLTGETVTAIANQFNVARQTVPVIFRRITKEKSPGSQQHEG